MWLLGRLKEQQHAGSMEIFRNYGNGFKSAILLNRSYARTVMKHCKRC